MIYFISYVTEVPFPSREVAVMFCHSAELKKNYFGVSLAYFFFNYLHVWKNTCSHDGVGRSIKIINLAFI